MLRYNPTNATVSGQVVYLRQQIASISATPMVIETDPINPMIIAGSTNDSFDEIAQILEKNLLPHISS